jgi:hypothetical protein
MTVGWFWFGQTATWLGGLCDPFLIAHEQARSELQAAVATLGQIRQQALPSFDF